MAGKEEFTPKSERIIPEDGNHTIEKVENVNGAIKDETTKQSSQLLSSLNQPTNQEEVETADEQIDFVELYEQQLKARDQINEYYRKNEIKHPSGRINGVTAQEVSVYFDETTGEKIMITNSNFDNSHVFIEKEGSIEEITLSDKIKKNERMQRIYEVGKYFRIEVVEPTGNIAIPTKGSKNYYINKKGQYIPELGDQTGEYSFSKNDFGGYQYEKEISKNKESGKVKKSYIIYNENMQKIASFEDGDKGTYEVIYCDDNICICSLENNGKKSYVIFKEGELIHEGEMENLEKDLEGIDYMKNYFDYQNEKRIESERKKEEYKEQKQRKALPFEERYKDINNCEIIYNNDECSDITIKNNKGEELYQFGDIEKRDYTLEHRPTFYRNNGNEIIEIKNRTSDNNMLFIQITNIKENTKQSIFINKETGDTHEFNGDEGRYSFRYGKVIIIHHDGKEDETAYDDNFNCLGVIYDGRLCSSSNDGYYVVKKKKEGEEEKDGKINYDYYIVSIKKGKILSKCCDIDGNGRFYAAKYEKDGKIYLVVYSGNGKKQVEIEK